jgi:hypothetical protein
MRRLEGEVEDSLYAMAVEDAKKKGLSIQEWIAFAVREYLSREHFSTQEITIGERDPRFHVDRISPGVRREAPGPAAPLNRTDRGSGPHGGVASSEEEPEVCMPPALLRFEREIDRAGIELDSMEGELEHLRLELERVRNLPGQKTAVDRLSWEIEKKSYEIENFKEELGLLMTKRDEVRARRNH